MIPKIIHVIWLSSDNINDIPEKFQRCFETIDKHLIQKGYELKFWNKNCVDMFIDNDFFRYHYVRKNFAFCSDYVRLFALYHFGGFYLDLDVDVIGDFDKVLNLKSYIGLERVHYDNKDDISIGGYDIDCAIMGFEKENQICNTLLNWLLLCGDKSYYGERFILPNLVSMAVRCTNYKVVNSIDEAKECEKSNIVPIFNQPTFDDHTSNVKGQDYKIARHNFFNSWV